MCTTLSLRKGLWVVFGQLTKPGEEVIEGLMQILVTRERMRENERERVDFDPVTR